jgi:hypothetical protein
MKLHPRPDPPFAKSFNAMDAMERPWSPGNTPAIHMSPLRPSLFHGVHCVDALRVLEAGA